MKIWTHLIWGVLGLGLAVQADAASSLQSAYIVLGPDMNQVARVLTTETSCPTLKIDGRLKAMTLRASAKTIDLRPTQSKPELSKPSVFDITTCEADIRPGVKSVYVGSLRLPVRKQRLDRLVVIGDTGCRLKASSNEFQACTDGDKYPFARLAELAAAWHPDAVVHVGDYHYRENPCPDGNVACAGSPWGYGWDAWNADFFKPAAPLLLQAPLILARGNHENCSRAGQGWWRFLDPRPMEYQRDCNEQDHDKIGDYSPPYAVNLGGSAQIVVMDLSIAGDKALAATDPRVAEFQDTYAQLDKLSQGSAFTFALNHYPILGVSAEDKKGEIHLRPGNSAIQSSFGSATRPLLPEHVNVLLAGHVHLWEQVSFAAPFPSQFIAGFSGTEEDKVPLPEKLPTDFSPAAGAIIEQFSSWVDGFGYMTLERLGTKVWKVKVWNLKGKIVNTCMINDHKSKCAMATVGKPLPITLSK